MRFGMGSVMNRALFSTIVVATLALAACASPADQSSPTSEPSTSLPMPSPRESESASAAATSPGLSPSPEPVWQPTWSEAPFPGTVHGVAVDGDRLIAVGRDAEGLAAWISSDGASWERHPIPDPTVDTPIPDGWAMGPIVRLGETFFSFGTLQGGGDFRRPVAWRSSDGVAWEFIESSSEFFQSGGLAGVVASDLALVAVTEGGLIAPYQTAWRWTAETSWTKSDVASTSDRPLVIHDVVWNGGTYLAVGAGYDPQDAERWYESTEPGLWRSSDGRSWTSLAPPSGMGSGCAQLAATVDGFLLIGPSADGPASWSSRDGSEWSMIAPIGDATDATCSVGLSAVKGRFLALRNTGDGMVLSASPDAANWFDSEFPGMRASDTLVAVLGEGVLVFARQTSLEGPSVVLRGTIE